MAGIDKDTQKPENGTNGFRGLDSDSEAGRQKVSNHWKKFFQSLEKSGKFFPIIGKPAKNFSNRWKTVVFIPRLPSSGKHHLPNRWNNPDARP
jgi:hypothetical protein